MLQFENFKEYCQFHSITEIIPYEKLANLKEKNWDQKWGHAEKNDGLFSNEKKKSRSFLHS